MRKIDLLSSYPEIIDLQDFYSFTNYYKLRYALPHNSI
jgi:hypothetical protein